MATQLTNHAICGAFLAQQAHAWDGLDVPEDPSDYTPTDEPTPEDRRWAADQPESPFQSQLQQLYKLDGEQFGRIVRACNARLGDLDKMPTTIMIALYYQLDWALRDRLS